MTDSVNSAATKAGGARRSPGFVPKCRPASANLLPLDLPPTVAGRGVFPTVAIFENSRMRFSSKRRFLPVPEPESGNLGRFGGAWMDELASAAARPRTAAAQGPRPMRTNLACLNHAPRAPVLARQSIVAYRGFKLATLAVASPQSIHI